MARFSKTQKFTKRNIENVPGNKAIIYKIKNSKGQNLYTGIAGRYRGEERLMEHRNLKSEKIPGGTRFQVAQVKNKDRAIQIEKQILKREQPKYNNQGK